jgi:hypothetical protein
MLKVDHAQNKLTTIELNEGYFITMPLPTRIDNRLRRQDGAMLGIVIVMLAIIVFIGIAGLTTNGLWLNYWHAQVDADATALSLASGINIGDRVGQINELEECSRELLYVSGQANKQCEEPDFQILASLAHSLNNEAISGHDLVERERQNQINLIAQEMRDSVRKYNANQSWAPTVRLPWIEIEKPIITQVEVGAIDGGQSNVKSLDTIEELADYDRSMGYLDNRTQLFKGNINATLPNDAQGLTFKISALPARIKGTCAPARNTNPLVFKKGITVFSNNNFGSSQSASQGGQIPNAVQVSYAMHTSLLLRDKCDGNLHLVSTATTNGAVTGSN